MKLDINRYSNIGKLVIIIGILVGFPIVVIPFYRKDIVYIGAFLIPALFSIFLGILICIFYKKDENSNTLDDIIQNSYITVLFIWIYAIIAGAMPFVLAHQLDLVQGIFEAVSGWTTTGLSTVDVTKCPNIFLFHRSFMQLCGGLGFVMLMVMFIQGKQSMNLFNAEGHTDKLMPNLKKTAQTITVMYLSFFAIGSVFYMIFGMNFFESILHSMSSLSTGGFSTRVDSIGAYHSIGIEFVTIILMIIGTTNFAVLLLLCKGKIKQVIKVSEIRCTFLIIAVSTFILVISLCYNLYHNAYLSFRIAIFNSISAISTTGYSTVAYSDWSNFSIGIMILLMLIGGGIGSTAGGMKISRFYLLIKITSENIIKRVSSSRRVRSPYYYKAQGKTIIDNELAMDVFGFVTCYILIFITGTLLIVLTANTSIRNAMFEFASSLGTVGLSIGLTDGNTNNATLIVEIIGMILGRLEIFIVLIGVYSSFNVIKDRLSLLFRYPKKNK